MKVLGLEERSRLWQPEEGKSYIEYLRDSNYPDKWKKMYIKQYEEEMQSLS